MPYISFGSRTRPKRCIVGLGLPGAKPRAGPGARGAALLAVGAVVGPELVFEVEGLVAPLVVVVADDVVRARDDAARHSRCTGPTG